MTKSKLEKELDELKKEMRRMKKSYSSEINNLKKTCCASHTSQNGNVPLNPGLLQINQKINTEQNTKISNLQQINEQQTNQIKIIQTTQADHSAKLADLQASCANTSTDTGNCTQICGNCVTYNNKGDVSLRSGADLQITDGTFTMTGNSYGGPWNNLQLSNDGPGTQFLVGGGNHPLYLGAQVQGIKINADNEVEQVPVTIIENGLTVTDKGLTVTDGGLTVNSGLVTGNDGFTTTSGSFTTDTGGFTTTSGDFLNKTGGRLILNQNSHPDGKSEIGVFGHGNIYNYSNEWCWWSNGPHCTGLST